MAASESPMHVNPPENPVEDRIIDALDRGISPSRRDVEMENIRAAMRQAERLKFEKLTKNAGDSR
jgi:hypothetical protein